MPMKLFRIICLFLSVLGTVHLERLAWEAILDAFSICGTARIARKSEAFLYFLLIPVLVICLYKYRKSKSMLDRMVRIAALIFFGAFLIYWYFEDFFNFFSLLAYW